MTTGAFSRESLPLAAGDIQQLLSELNFRLMHISDRLDKIESIRGSFEIAGDQDVGGALAVGGTLSVADVVSFATNVEILGAITIGLTAAITGNTTISGTLEATAMEEVLIYDDTNTLIHAMSKTP